MDSNNRSYGHNSVQNTFNKQDSNTQEIIKHSENGALKYRAFRNKKWGHEFRNLNEWVSIIREENITKMGDKSEAVPRIIGKKKNEIAIMSEKTQYVPNRSLWKREARNKIWRDNRRLTILQNYWRS